MVERSDEEGPAVAFAIMFRFGAYAFVWGTISTTVRQRLVPMRLHGRIAQTWGVTAPWQFAFAGSGVTLLIAWRSISQIAAARPALGDDGV